MKKWLCVLLVGVLLVCMTACKDVPTDPANDAAQNGAATTTATTATTASDTPTTAVVSGADTTATTPPTTATPTAPADKTAKPTAVKTTATTNAYTAADLYFPIHNKALKTPGNAVMKEVSIGFDWAQKRVRMQLPETMTVKVTQQGSRSYAAIYCGKVRVGRLVPNFVFPDTVSGDLESELEVAGYAVNHFSYTAGKQVAYTYSALMMPDDAFFYVLEISADYISASDLVTCLQSLRSIQLLERNNRLESRGKDNLRIAIAGNSFVGYSNVVQQLQAILDANGKNVDVDEHWFPNITITDFAYDAGKLNMLCGGNYDMLFINGAYTGDDANNLPFLEEACIASGTELVLFPAHNEAPESTILAYRNTTVKLVPWHDAILTLLDNGIAESDLIYYDGVRHSKPLAGFCGAVMIYGMLYETAPNAAAIGVRHSGVSQEIAQKVEDLTMECIRPYFE